MKLNPTLKDILVRIGCLAGSLFAYVFVVNQLHFSHYTLCGITLFSVALLLIVFNLRPLARPIRQLFIALFVLAFASVVFWHKVEYLPWPMYRNMLVYTPLGFVLLASLLPIFLRRVQAVRLAGCGKAMLWAAVLWLDFAAAFPNVAFSELDAEGAYMGVVHVDNPDKTHEVPLRTFAFAHQKWGLSAAEQVDVLIPADPEGKLYECRRYLRDRNCDYLVDTLARDTIWICERGVRYTPNRKTMENIELAALRHQWQYAMWHYVKKRFNK